jgi:hypothetical protein
MVAEYAAIFFSYSYISEGLEGSMDWRSVVKPRSPPVKLIILPPNLDKISY